MATNILKVGGDLDPLKPPRPERIVRATFRFATAAIDTVGLCLFVAFPVLDNPEVPWAMW